MARRDGGAAPRPGAGARRGGGAGGGDGGDGGSRRPLDDRVVLKDPELLEAEIERLRAKAQGNTSKGAGSRAEDREAAEKDAGRLKMLLVQRARLKERDARRQKMRQDYEARDVRPTGPAPPPSQRRRHGGGGGARSEERIKFTNLQGRKIAIGGQGGVPLPPKPGQASSAASAFRAPSPPPWPPEPLRPIPPPPREPNARLRPIPPPPPNDTHVSQPHKKHRTEPQETASAAPEHQDPREASVVRASIDLSKYDRGSS